ncbi:MAG TPA: diacylglycerol kinase family protein [Chthoniobacterales bacterium]|nr:diacylglycerol kinase family protein [Chthoniobacterales bacterium]
MTRFTQVALIQNPASGNVDGPARLAVRSELTKTVRLWKELVLEPDRSIADLTLELLREGVDLIAVAGGDGTVREVASTLVGTAVPLLVIPLGTFNNFARSLALPADPIRACQLVDTGAVQRIDVGIANGRHFFFEAAGVGVDAQLFPLGEAMKQGRFAAVVRLVEVAFVHRQTAVELNFDRPLERAYQRSFRGESPVRHRRRRFRNDRRRIRLRSSFVAVGNGPYYGGNFTVCPEARLDDGLLSVGVFRDFSKRELLSHFLSISRGRRQYHPKLEIFECAWLEVMAKEKLQVHVDGLPVGTTPVRFSVRPRALDVMVPAG